MVVLPINGGGSIHKPVMVIERLTCGLIHELSEALQCNSRNYLTAASVDLFGTLWSMSMKLGLFIAILSGAAVLLWPRPAYGRRREQVKEDDCASSAIRETDSEIVRDPRDLRA